MIEILIAEQIIDYILNDSLVMLMSRSLTTY